MFLFRSCSNSYISFYEGATTESHRIYNFNPSPRFCKVRDFRLSFILPSNVTTISYRAGSSQPWLFQVSYSIYGMNKIHRYVTSHVKCFDFFSCALKIDCCMKQLEFLCFVIILLKKALLIQKCTLFFFHLQKLFTSYDYE